MKFDLNQFIPIDQEKLKKDIVSARISKSAQQIINYGLLIFILVVSGGVISSYFFLEGVFLYLTISLSFILALIGFYLPRYYIKILKDSRKRKIDIDLGSSITFMYALSSGNMNLPEIFRRLATHEKAFGEMAQEAKFIVTEIDYFSSDLESAINELIRTTPSEKLKDFLTDLIPVMRAGGNVTSYLGDRSQEYLNEAIEEQEKFIEFLGYISEGYIAGFVAGPLMIILGIVIMVLSFGQAPTPLYYLIYILLPLGGLLFVILLKSISPINTLEVEKIETQKRFGVNITSSKEVEPTKIKTSIFTKIKYFYSSLLNKPYKTLVISAPISVAFFIERYYFIGFSEIYNDIETYTLILMLLLLAPISIFFEIKRIRDKRIRKGFPDFLRILEGLNKTGMTLKKTFLEVSDMSGIIGKKLKMVKRGIQWNFNLNNLLKRFSNALNEKEITRSIIIMLEGTRAHGNISEVLRVTKNDSTKRKELFESRKMNIQPYIILVWVSFLIFLGTAFIFRESFLGSIPTSEMATGEFGFSLGQMELISDIITHSSMIMGFISGIIAGELSEGTILAGLKHSIFMVIIAYVVLIVII